MGVSVALSAVRRAERALGVFQIGGEGALVDACAVEVAQVGGVAFFVAGSALVGRANAGETAFPTGGADSWSGLVGPLVADRVDALAVP